MSDRVYRAVLLTAEEAALLAEEARFHSARERCCPHLDRFHNQGNLSGGGTWRACQFTDCGCNHSSPEPWVGERREREKRSEFWNAFGCGAMAVFVALVLLGLIATWVS